MIPFVILEKDFPDSIVSPNPHVRIPSRAFRVNTAMSAKSGSYSSSCRFARQAAPSEPSTKCYYRVPLCGILAINLFFLLAPGKPGGRESIFTRLADLARGMAWCHMFLALVPAERRHGSRGRGGVFFCTDPEFCWGLGQILVRYIFLSNGIWMGRITKRWKWRSYR